MAPPPRPVALDTLLQRQGFGTRRACRVLVHQGRVTVAGEPVDDPDAAFVAEGLPFAVDGEPWVASEFVYLMLHKPVGYEVSRKPQHHLSVHGLLPGPYNERGVQAAGRLDTDTSGLLLLSDDGGFVHALTAPKREVAKTYEVTLVHPDEGGLVHRLRSGVLLRDEDEPSVAHAVVQTSATTLRLVLTEGKYHQVKRMIAAAGNRVAALHRPAVGALRLPADLAPGTWRRLEAAEREALFAEPARP
jgi:16S rRNA pseudouridine516 synthase